MRTHLRLLCRQRRALSRIGTDQDRSPQEFCRFPTARRRTGGDAVEFSVLAAFFRFAAPGVMAGNGAVMKLSSNVPGCALAIEQVFQEAGFPKNLFRTLMIGSAKVEAVIENPLVRAVT